MLAATSTWFIPSPTGGQISSALIQRSTAVLIDKSAGMSAAIHAGGALLDLIGPTARGPLLAYAFDTMVHYLQRQARDDGSWRRPLAEITPGGLKACGIVVESMRLRRQRVEQIVLITDERESAAPTFAESLRSYAADMGFTPDVCLIRMDDSEDFIEQDCREAGLPVEVVDYDGDPAALEPLLQWLARPLLS
jgi:hypothetical protein